MELLNQLISLMKIIINSVLKLKNGNEKNDN